MGTKSTPTRRRSSWAAAVLGTALLLADPAAADDACDPAAPPPAFALHFGDEVSGLALIATAVMPGTDLDLHAAPTHEGARLEATADGVALVPRAPDRWRWSAPAEPGTHALVVRDGVSGTRACLRVFVLRPYAGETNVDGYEIGAYPPGASPPGLVRVDEGMLDLPLSPHFRLRPFLPKQEGGFPKYLVLSTRLLLALEAITAALPSPAHGQLAVMSGYRTPYYHAAIGNTTTTSRHLFGEAADVYVDRDGDGRMDDLDADGQVADADARLLYGWIDALSAQPSFAPFTGGLSLYPTAPHRGPFVHVDVRGQPVRW
jgi:hypothetical protein